MGDAQSAQREGKKDAAAEEESGKVDDAQTEQNTEDKVSCHFPQIQIVDILQMTPITFTDKLNNGFSSLYAFSATAVRHYVV